VADFKTINLTRCSDVIITYGQWDLTVTVYENYRLHPNNTYSIENMFRESVKSMVQGLAKLHYGRRIYLLSMNYTPLRNKYFQVLNTSYELPPYPFSRRKDEYLMPGFNTPPFVDEFNDVLSSEVALLNHSEVTFFDQRDILGPLWDTAPDYNHCSHVVGEVMTKNLLCAMFPISSQSLGESGLLG
jgi:hypothetical protein